MRKTLYLSILLLASCQALHRGIPKAPRNRIVLQETAKTEQHNDLNSKIFSDENETKNKEDKEVFPIQSSVNEGLSEKERESILLSKEKSSSTEFKQTLSDTLIIDQSELDRGERISKNQKAINIVMIVTIFGFYLATIFLIWGVINVILGDQLAYVTQEVDNQLRERKRNFFIILGVKLVLLLILLGLILFLF
jgi:hypothetical protein